MRERDPELIDYLAVLWRWKWLIASGTLLAAAIALWGPIRPSEGYIASRTIDVGLPTEPYSKNIESFVASLQRRRPDSLILQSTAPGVLHLEVGSRSEADARARLAALTASVQPELEKVIEAERARLAVAERQREQLRTLTSQLRNLQVDTVRGDRSANALLLFSAISTELVRVEGLLGDLGAPEGTPPPVLRLGEITIRLAPGLSRRLLAFVATLGALIAFVSLAFLADYITHARSRPGAPEDVSSVTRAV